MQQYKYKNALITLTVAIIFTSQPS